MVSTGWYWLGSLLSLLIGGPPAVADLWIFGRVADFLENGRFTRIGSADNKNPKPSKFLPDVFDLDGSKSHE